MKNEFSWLPRERLGEAQPVPITFGKAISRNKGKTLDKFYLTHLGKYGYQNVDISGINFAA